MPISIFRFLREGVPALLRRVASLCFFDLAKSSGSVTLLITAIMAYVNWKNRPDIEDIRRIQSKRMYVP